MTMLVQCNASPPPPTIGEVLLLFDSLSLCFALKRWMWCPGAITLVCPSQQFEYLSLSFHLLPLPAWVLALLWSESRQGILFLQKQFWSSSPSDISFWYLVPVQSCIRAEGGMGGPSTTRLLKVASFAGCSFTVTLSQRMWYLTGSTATCIA